MQAAPDRAPAEPTPPESRGIRWLAQVAVGLCVVSVFASLALGWATYRRSVHEIERRFERLYMAKARLVAGEEALNRGLSDAQLLGRIETLWRSGGERPADEYLCVVDERARLVLHTADPRTVGSPVGQNRLLGEAGGVAQLGDLVGTGDDYLGDYVSSAGELQLAAFHAVPGRAWHLGVHRSKRAMRQEAAAGLRSLAIGFRIVSGGALPLALLVLFFVVVRALRARDAADAALRRSEQHHRAIAEDMPTLLCRFRPDCVLTYVNDAYATYFSSTREEMVGVDFLTLIPREQGAELVRQLEALTPACDTHVSEHEVFVAGEQPRWQRWTNRALFDRAGQLIEYQAVGEDITDRRRLAARLEQAARMEAVGRLAGGVAHDLNNMLTPILACSSLLEEELAARPDQVELAADIGIAGRRARDVVQQLLAFSRRQPLSRRDVELGEVLEGIEPMLRRTIREDVRIEVDPGEDLPIVQADVGQLEQVILNLAINARDAMPGGGVMRLRLRRYSGDPTAGSREPGTWALLEVQDEGAGMDERTRARVFEPFFTTKEEGKGTGLGLSTVLGIVQQHGGEVLCDSEPGRGTVFRVFLPEGRSAQQPDDVSPPVEPGDAGSGSGLILLVEDDPLVRRMALRVLRRSGYTVLSAADGRAALSIAATLTSPPDLLLSDVVMPGLQGPDLHRQLAEGWPGLRVLYMSGYVDEAERSVDPSADLLLRKPFTAAALVKRVEALLAG